MPTCRTCSVHTGIFSLHWLLLDVVTVVNVKSAGAQLKSRYSRTFRPLCPAIKDILRKERLDRIVSIAFERLH